MSPAALLAEPSPCLVHFVRVQVPGGRPTCSRRGLLPQRLVPVIPRRADGTFGICASRRRCDLHCGCDVIPRGRRRRLLDAQRTTRHASLQDPDRADRRVPCWLWAGHPTHTHARLGAHPAEASGCRPTAWGHVQPTHVRDYFWRRSAARRAGGVRPDPTRHQRHQRQERRAV